MLPDHLIRHPIVRHPQSYFDDRLAQLQAAPASAATPPAATTPPAASMAGGGGLFGGTGLGGGFDFRKLMMAQAIGNALTALANGGRVPGGGGGFNMAAMMRMQMAQQADATERAKLARQQAAISSYFDQPTTGDPGQTRGQADPATAALAGAFPGRAASQLLGAAFDQPSKSIKKVRQDDGSYRWQQVTGTENDLFQAPPPGNSAKPKFMPIAGGLQQMHNWNADALRWEPDPASKPISRWKPASADDDDKTKPRMFDISGDEKAWHNWDEASGQWELDPKKTAIPRSSGSASTIKPKYMPIAGGKQQLHNWDEVQQRWVADPRSVPINRWKPPKRGDETKPKIFDVTGEYKAWHNWNQTTNQWEADPNRQPIPRKTDSRRNILLGGGEMETPEGLTVPRWRPRAAIDPSGLSTANKRTNTETIRSRETLEAMDFASFADLVAAQQTTDLAGVDNPAGRHITGLVRDATRPLYGDDPDLQRYIDRYLTGTGWPDPSTGAGAAPPPPPPPEEGAGFLEGASDAVKSAWKGIFPGTTPAEAGLESGAPLAGPNAPLGQGQQLGAMTDEEFALGVKNFEMLSESKKAQVRAEAARRRAASGQ